MLRRLHAYWEAKRRERRLPARSDMGSRRDRAAVAAHPAGGRRAWPVVAVQVRLAGTYVKAAIDQRLKGAYLEQVKLDRQTETILSLYEAVVLQSQPVVSRHVFINEDGRSFDYERLLLPLMVHGENRVYMNLAGICFDAPSPTPNIPFVS